MLCLHTISPSMKNVWISNKFYFWILCVSNGNTFKIWKFIWPNLLSSFCHNSVNPIKLQDTYMWLREGLLVYFDLLILCYSPLENRVIEVIETTVIRFFNWQGYIEKYMYNYCTLNRILRNSKCKIEWLPLVICKSTFLRIIKPSAERQECFGPFSYL
jgi:hypothetical protein